jgi:hypothetical protein
MIALRNILVDEDAVATHHPALEQALGLARRCGARVTITQSLIVGSGLQPHDARRD